MLPVFAIDAHKASCTYVVRHSHDNGAASCQGVLLAAQREWRLTMDGPARFSFCRAPRRAAITSVEKGGPQPQCGQLYHVPEPIRVAANRSIPRVWSTIVRGLGPDAE